SKALDALTFEPEGFIEDHNVYLGLRSVYHRLFQDSSREGLRSSVDQLWHVALRIEDGGELTDAERRLRDIQDQLSKALEEGAAGEGIARLLQVLRQAIAEFTERLASQAQGQQMQMPEGFNPNEIMRPQDLQRMLDQLENMARQGSREMAQQMLDQLRELMESLQAGRMMGQQGQQGQQMIQMMDQMGDIICRQQQLYDDTFGEQQRQRQQGQQGQQMMQMIEQIATIIGRQQQLYDDTDREQQRQGQRGQRGQRGERGQQGQQVGRRGEGLRGQQGLGQQGQQGQGQQGQRF